MEKTHVERFWRTLGNHPCLVEHWGELDSTNDRARELLREIPTPVVVTAAHQRAGRGRHGRRWQDLPSSALLMSLGISSQWLGQRATPLEVLAAAALATLDELSAYAESHQLALKYPNDIWVKPEGLVPGKLGGILIESDYTGWRLGTVVVGIGINLTASPEVDEYAYPVRCLVQIASSPIPTAEQFAERLVERIIDRLSYDCHSTIPEWMAALRLIGRTVHLRSTNEPVHIIGFDSDGSLRAMDQSGSLRILRDGDSLLYDPFVQ